MTAWIIPILAIIAALALLILIHELGHFIAAKASGVKVEEFGLGFPPRLLAVQRGETKYSLNLLPLGGFVKLAGEEDPKVPRSLAGKSVGIRALVLGAGSLMNLLLPIALFSISLMAPHQVAVGQVRIDEVAANSPAQTAGLQQGEIILKLNDSEIRNLGDLYYNTQLHLGQEVTMLVEKSDSTPKLVTMVPRWNPPQGEGSLGVKISLVNSTVVSESLPFWKAIPSGARQCIDTLILFKNEIVSMIVRKAAPEVIGPVGIAQVTGEVARAGLSPLLQFVAFLSLNLAIVNLLPIPGLDGGRLVFVFLEWVRRGKKVSPQRERVVHFIGFALLITLIIVVSYYDILRIVRGGSVP